MLEQMRQDKSNANAQRIITEAGTSAFNMSKLTKLQNLNEKYGKQLKALEEEANHIKDSDTAEDVADKVLGILSFGLVSIKRPRQEEQAKNIARRAEEATKEFNREYSATAGDASYSNFEYTKPKDV